MRGKLPGRVGDSPLVGAGTWAEDATCAVSATGDGEAIVRAVAAHDVARLVAYRGLSLADACAAVVRERVGGEAGLVALGPTGGPVFEANVPLFNRAAKLGDEPVRTAIATASPLRPAP
jgi:L-asparaginase / beta-aspartyl-peptidase